MSVTRTFTVTVSNPGSGNKYYIDGVLTPHVRVNYVLRGMKIPAGTHEIVFQFEPSVIQNGRMISLIAYGLLLLLPIGWFFYEKKGVK